MKSVVLFGVSSPIVVDVEETCRRAGWTIKLGIRNVPQEPFVSDDVDVVESLEGLVLTDPVLLPMFSPKNRDLAWRQARSLGAEYFPVLVDPTTILPSRFEAGEGTYINAGCTFGAASRLGRFAFVNRGASLGHHLDLGEFASVGPGATVAGQVTIGAGAMIGAGAVILPGIRIGAGAIVGAGVVIEDDVPAGAMRRSRRGE